MKSLTRGSMISNINKKIKNSNDNLTLIKGNKNYENG